MSMIEYEVACKKMKNVEWISIYMWQLKGQRIYWNPNFVNEWDSIIKVIITPSECYLFIIHTLGIKGLYK